jgi:hypothetical protein
MRNETNLSDYTGDLVPGKYEAHVEDDKHDKQPKQYQGWSRGGETDRVDRTRSITGHTNWPFSSRQISS